MSGMERMTGIGVGPAPEPFMAENSVLDKKPKKARKRKPKKVTTTPKKVATPKRAASLVKTDVPYDDLKAKKEK